MRNLVSISPSFFCDFSSISNDFIKVHEFSNYISLTTNYKVLYDFLVTVKTAPHECVIRTGQP